MPDLLFFDKALREGVDRLSLGDDGDDLFLAVGMPKVPEPFQNARMVPGLRRAEQGEIAAAAKAQPSLIVKLLLGVLQQDAAVVQPLRQLHAAGESVAPDAVGELLRQLLVMLHEQDADVIALRHMLPLSAQRGELRQSGQRRVKVR